MLPILVLQGVYDNKPEKLRVYLVLINKWYLDKRTKVSLVQNGRELEVYNGYKGKSIFWWNGLSKAADDTDLSWYASLVFSLEGLDVVSTAEIVVEIVGSEFEPIRVPVNPYFIKEKKEGV